MLHGGLIASLTYIIPIVASPLSAGLSISGCILRSDAIPATACLMPKLSKRDSDGEIPKSACV